MKKECFITASSLSQNTSMAIKINMHTWRKSSRSNSEI